MKSPRHASDPDRRPLRDQSFLNGWRDWRWKKFGAVFREIFLRRPLHHPTHDETASSAAQAQSRKSAPQSHRSSAHQTSSHQSSAHHSPSQHSFALPGQFFSRLKKKWIAGIQKIDHAWVPGTQRWSQHKPIVLLLLLAMFAMCLVVVSTPLTVSAQIVFCLLVGLVLVSARYLRGRLAGLVLVTFSLLITGRYIWWRSTNTLEFDTWFEAVLGWILFGAEVYTWIILLLGHLQTIWPLQRKPLPLPADSATWPSVDVYIVTYNEPLAVVKPALFGAKGMDWPHGKLNIYLLDDGHRPEFKDFAESIDVHYIARDEHAAAKAGNINHALGITTGEYIAVFDCDHIPTRSFLQTTMGQFLADPRCALLQTPHQFFSPDPFERNLNIYRQIPNENRLFYGLAQDGNDFWNATFFCGSCAILKRSALLEVGGLSTESVTEDAHTTLKLHRLGYRTAYLPVVQAAGLATESLAGHITQRVRWARGMMQIFRIDNPLLGRGLRLMQRLCYANSMLHFLFGLPRLIFLTMPLMYLYLGLHIVNTRGWEICIYLIPHIIAAYYTNSIVQGKFRHPFWAPIYEVVMAWYISWPALLALINPHPGAFNVTAKGNQIQKEFIDWTISIPYLILVALNLGGFFLGLWHLAGASGNDIPASVLNLTWSFANLTTLGAAIGVASEARQVRIAHHIPMSIPIALQLEDGRTLACHTEDYSKDGMGIWLPGDYLIPKKSRVTVFLKRGAIEHAFEGVVLYSKERRLGVYFDKLSVHEEMQLVQSTFGRADAWLNWYKEETPATLTRGLFDVIKMGGYGYLRLFQMAKRSLEQRRRLRLR